MALRNAFGELATEAEQAQARALLEDLRDLIGAAVSDSVLIVLRQIAANTGTPIADIAQLELTAEQVQLNTDTLEAKVQAVVDALTGRLPAALDGGRLAVRADGTVGLDATTLGAFDDQLRAMPVAVILSAFAEDLALIIEDLPLPTNAATSARQDLARSVLEAIQDGIESADADYTQTVVTTGAAAGMPATRTYLTGRLAGMTTTWTYDSTYGTVLSRVTA